MLGFAKNRRRLIAQSVTALDKHAVNTLIQSRLVAFFQTKDSRELYRATPPLIAQRLQLSERETLNERLDYFGITVNTAARVQATSSGHNIAVTNAIAADLEPSFFIPDWTWQKENLMLKGIDNPVVVHYLQRAEGKKC
ncbi:MAG: hypothetical protein KME12_14910 [Trichocoleus desertorum ATA4-8-CV12]|jgi:class 3 adenylate cyclase|nr:hypothetical protein [Trichocoleus desertorum ATA4-8-CV12]